MLADILAPLFRRDLERLKNELLQYQDEHNIWRIDKNILNSAGNLCLHLVGNLNNYIGSVLGKSGYIRHRELEFSLKNIPRTTLLSSIDDAIVVIDRTLPNIPENTWKENFPGTLNGEAVSIAYFLIHLTTHLSYHLGQVNYHRRLLDETEVLNA
ncbi:Protein of unknown function [Chitinophaga costaii]|uniref:DinB superfamily protein n=1 Tax=Chitinophaga costaii TaxID=1335309 RepID=A0A1C4A9H6_9BACT|nr:DUF1572 family protein [Chitinophaga costaii]PUZ26865.1 DUF1572 domain-containing protein [Chitinophaga costaii]SCB91344.1 Protein of unknown function [Chitinophaga costaii]